MTLKARVVRNDGTIATIDACWLAPSTTVDVYYCNGERVGILEWFEDNAVWMRFDGWRGAFLLAKALLKIMFAGHVTVVLPREDKHVVTAKAGVL